MSPAQEQKLDEIHQLLAGSLEKKGLVHKVDEMELHVKDLKDYKDKDEKLKNKVAGGVAVGVPVISGIWTLIWNKLTGH